MPCADRSEKGAAGIGHAGLIWRGAKMLTRRGMMYIVCALMGLIGYFTPELQASPNWSFPLYLLILFGGFLTFLVLGLPRTPERHLHRSEEGGQ